MARPSASLGPRADLEFAPMFYRDDDGLYFLVVICSGRRCTPTTGAALTPDELANLRRRLADLASK